jgi:hypothetical protein
MKRITKIIIVIIPVLLILGIYFGYQVYKSVMGSELLNGTQENIPKKMSSIPSVTKGLSDWPNWRGANFEGKSATTGIQTDWSKGLKIWWNVNYLCQDQATASWSSPFVQGNRLIVPGRIKTMICYFA